MDAETIEFAQLLSASVSAAFAAGDVIREVVNNDIAFDLVNKTENEYDPQTVADRRAQLRIVHALRQHFPAVQIVGEEGDLGEPEPQDIVQVDTEAIAFQELHISLPKPLLPAKDLVLWIDPLDGTKRFAAKEFDEVSVLIGIALEKGPIAGVMHFPFRGPLGTSFWGGVDIGVFTCVHGTSDLRTVQHVRMQRPPPKATDAQKITLTRSISGCDLIDVLLQRVEVDSVLYGLATGAMILTVIQGHSDSYLRFRRNTKRWDICAVESLVLAMGGRIVNKYGELYLYDPVTDNDYDNADGLFVFLDERVNQTIHRAIQEVEFMRTLDGQPFTSESLGQLLSQPVASFDMVPGSISRGRQSITGRLQVTFESGDQQHSECIFVKRIVYQELVDKSPPRWSRNMPSYRNECRFYQDCYELLAPSVQLIRPLSVSQSVEPSFMLMLDDLHQKDFVQLDCLTFDQAKAGLRYLASLHATAWGAPDILERINGRLWPAGGWWQLEKRGMKELQQCRDVWSGFARSFARVAPDQFFASETMIALADRMIEYAPFISANLFDEEHIRPWKTLVHGDFKSANLFFHKDLLDVVAFDWQWSGSGLAAIDVAYFLNTSVAIDALDNGHEIALLQFYYDELTKKLASRNQDPLSLAASGYSFDAFRRHYDYGLLEYARVLLSAFWKQLTPDNCQAKASQRNCGLGYRSIAHALRLAKRMDELLQFVADEQRDVK